MTLPEHAMARYSACLSSSYSARSAVAAGSAEPGPELRSLRTQLRTLAEGTRNFAAAAVAPPRLCRRLCSTAKATALARSRRSVAQRTRSAGVQAGVPTAANSYAAELTHGLMRRSVGASWRAATSVSCAACARSQ